MIFTPTETFPSLIAIESKIRPNIPGTSFHSNKSVVDPRSGKNSWRSTILSFSSNPPNSQVKEGRYPFFQLTTKSFPKVIVKWICRAFSGVYRLPMKNWNRCQIHESNLCLPFVDSYEEAKPLFGWAVWKPPKDDRLPIRDWTLKYTRPGWSRPL